MGVGQIRMAQQPAQGRPRCRGPTAGQGQIVAGDAGGGKFLAAYVAAIVGHGHGHVMAALRQAQRQVAHMGAPAAQR